MNRMNRTGTIAVVIILILLTTLTTVSAVEELSFKDVNMKDWFYFDVMQLKKSNIVSGYGDGTFRPYNNVSKSEALAFIFRVTKEELIIAEAPQHWYDDLVLTAKSKYIIDDATEDMTLSATRQEVIDYVVRAMNLYYLPGPGIPLNFIDSSSPALQILSSMGIVKGSVNGGVRVFKPDTPITRAEMSAIIVRVSNFLLKDTNYARLFEDENRADARKVDSILDDENLLLKLKLGETPGVIGYLNNEALGSLFVKEKIDFTTAPNSIEEFKDLILFMSIQNLSTYSITYTGDNLEFINVANMNDIIFDGFGAAYSAYPEYMSFTNYIEYTLSGTTKEVVLTIKLTNEAKDAFSDISPKRTLFFKGMQDTINLLFAKERLVPTMSDTDKAKVLFDWVIQNTEYDFSFATDSYNGYGQYVNGSAVCQGYTSTYNALCKLVGLDVSGISGVAGADKNSLDNHIWTRALFAGENYFVDATWGDGYGDNITSNYDYFLVDATTLSVTHKWVD